MSTRCGSRPTLLDITWVAHQGKGGVVIYWHGLNGESTWNARACRMFVGENCPRSHNLPEEPDDLQEGAMDAGAFYGLLVPYRVTLTG